jgi:hypothetical protein
MEMRTILSQLLHQFTFTLTDAQRLAAEQDPGRLNLGVNRGTMGPRDTTLPQAMRSDGVEVPNLGLYLHATPRN